MDNKFSQIMSDYSDSKLIEIVTKLKDEYQPEAVEAANAEIKKRGLSQGRIDQAKKELKQKEEDERKKADTPLEPSAKILFLVFFWGVIPWIIASTYKNDGYLRKYKEAWRYILIGLGVYGALFVVLMIVVSIVF